MNTQAKILNEEKLQPSNEAKATFRGGVAAKRRLEPGHRLYKYSENPLLGGKQITEFWSSVVPIDPRDPGLTQYKQRAATVGTDPNQFARARAAVTKHWNQMTHLLIAEIRLPVFAFVGQTSGQLLEQSDEKVFLIGGAWQLWIPGLTDKYVVQVSRTPVATPPM